MSTEETSSVFGTNIQKVALFIAKDSIRDLSASGFFMRDGDFVAKWSFVHAEYNASSKTIILLDEDADTLICHPYAEKNMLVGAVCSQDEKKSLNFVRAGKKLENRLLYPRIPDDDGKISYSYQKPEQADDGLNTESIRRFSVDTSSFADLMKEVIDQKYGKIKSLLILKNNKLVAEEYFYGYQRDDLQQIHSCTKSVTSLLFGIALDHNRNIDYGERVFRFFPGYESLKSEGREDITLYHVLTMTTGLEWNDYPPQMYKTDDCFRYILSRPMAGKPGVSFNYNSGCSVLLGGIIQYLEGQKPLLFANEFLFTPLGIKNYKWESHRNDILRCGEGLSMRPRDMAKIGLLVLNDGKWYDRQIVSDAWVRESTKPHVQESDYFDYGYQWWHHSKNNLQWWQEPNAASPDEHDLITALGYAGQYIMIIRDLNLVIVTTASDFEGGSTALSKIPMAIERIIPLFENDTSRK